MSSVKVNEEKCIGCGACVAIAPENFDFNEVYQLLKVKILQKKLLALWKLVLFVL